VDYLGHVIRPGRLGVAEKNTDALRAAAPPRTHIELRSFLGLDNPYRRFVQQFSTFAEHLNSYLTKKKPALLRMLSTEALAAFESLRDKFLNPPILELPRRSGHLWCNGALAVCMIGCAGPPTPRCIILWSSHRHS
jgi:hypothetical protein